MRRLRRPSRSDDERIWLCLVCLEAAGWGATDAAAFREARAHLALRHPAWHPADGIRIFERPVNARPAPLPGGPDTPENVGRRLRVVRADYR